MGVYKAVISKMRLLLATAVLLPLMFGGCEDTEELVDPGPSGSFWISLKVSSNIAAEYVPMRVIIQTDESEDDKTGQLGQIAVSPITGTQRYKITLPESYYDRMLRFVVELRKIKSAFDEVEEVKNSAMALNLLKSRYCIVEKLIPKKAITDLELEVGAKAEIKLGFGPNGLELNDIPDAPLIYLLNILPHEDITNVYQFEFLGVMAVPVGSDPPSFTNVMDDLNGGVDGIYGFSLPDMDWGLVMLPSYEGGPFDILLFARQAKDTTVCPCGVGCGNSDCNGKITITIDMPVVGPVNETMCPYEAAAKFGYYHTIKKGIVNQEYLDKNIEIEGEENDNKLKTGSNIQIDVYQADLKSCKAFGADVQEFLDDMLK
jgi:hypothetical protein